MLKKIQNLNHEKATILDLRFFRGQKITKIEGLEKFTKLRELNLACNEITKIEGLEKLIHLKVLNFGDFFGIYGNLIAKIEGLEKLRSLNELYLSNNQISKIEGLEKLTSLNKLYLSRNQITKIEGLEKLISLKKLDLSINLITKIEGMEKLTSLNKLYLSRNQIPKIKGLEKLTSLNELSLYENQITKIEGLEKLTSLNELYLSNNQITKIEGLEKLISLNKLFLSNNQIAKIEGLEKVTLLNKLFLQNNKITKIEGLEKLTQLNRLDLSDNQITKIEGLKKMKKLIKFDLEKNQINLIEGMESLTNCVFNLRKNPIEKNHKNEVALKRMLDNIFNNVKCEIDISKRSYITSVLKKLSVEEESNTNMSRFFKNNLFLDFHQKIFKTMFFFNTIVNDTFKNFKDIKYFEGEDQEIILIDVRKDKKLKNFIEKDVNIRQLKKDYLSEHKKWKKTTGKLKKKSLLKIKEMIEERVIQKVSAFFGGTLKNNLKDNIAFFLKCEKEVHEIQNKNKSHFVNLGEIKTGVCRHRSLAFKIISDYIGLTCRLLGGTIKVKNDEPLPHMWNVVYLGNKFFAVDVLNSLTLIEEKYFNQFRRSYMNENGFGTIGGPTLFLEEKKETIEWITRNYRQKGSIASNEGVTSTIYKIDYNGKPFAVKEFQLKDGTSTIDFRKCFRKEIYYLRILNHPNVVKFVDCFVNRVEEVKEIKSQMGSHRTIKDVLLPGIILGYYDCSGEKLLQKLKEVKNKNEALIQTCVFLLGSAMGLRYLHSMNIVHLDLKPSNILIKWKDEKNVVIENVAVCDFGGCKENLFKRGVSKYDAPYTLGYCAPERFQQLNVIKVVEESKKEIIVDHKSDIYSFGKIMSQFKDYFYKDRGALFELESDCIKNESSERPSLDEIIYTLQRELNFLRNNEKEEIIDFVEFCKKGNKTRPMKMMDKTMERKRFKDDFSDFKDRYKLSNENNEQILVIESNDLDEEKKKIEEEKKKQKAEKDKLEKERREFEEEKKKQKAEKDKLEKERRELEEEKKKQKAMEEKMKKMMEEFERMKQEKTKKN